MKKTKTMRVAVLLLALTLITSCFVGSTFAKYTSSASGTDTATVAKWSIKVGENTDIAVSPAKTVAFNLFDTIKEADTTTAEDDVAAERIAPGTGGSFALIVENKSEVTAEYKIAFEETYTNFGTEYTPIQYRIDGGDNWSSAISDINATNIDMGEKATVTVQWKWDYDAGSSGANDAADTALGTAADAPTVTVKATITATQVD